MLKKIFFMVLLITFISCFSYEWNQIGPTDQNILNYETSFLGDVFCTDHGFYIGWEQDWQFHSVGELPVVDVYEIDTEFLIVLCNGGSYSDGIYKFDGNTSEFELLDFIFRPNFIHRTNEGFFVGFESGLLFSSDGLNWTEISFFNGMKIKSMITNGSHYVVTKTNMPTAIYISDDYGESWQESSHIVTNLGMIDLTYDYNDKLYGIFGGFSNSSGLWSSEDYGDHWEVEFYTDNLSSVYFVDDIIFIGWYNSWDWEGVAQYNPETHQLEMMNEGLENLHVNKFSTNDMIDCYNIVCCTMMGAFMCYDFEITNSDNEVLAPSDISMKNYPNPFNPETTISFELTEKDTKTAKIEIFNSKGQKIETFTFNGALLQAENSFTWNAKGQSSGVYFYCLKIDGKVIENRKMLFLK